jgi:anti-anti-sigma factor
MNVDVSSISGVAVVKPRGDIRVKTVLALRNALQEAGKPDARVAIDLSMVTFIDSSGLGLLVNFAKRLRKQNGRVCLFNFTDDIRALLNMVGIDQVVALYDTAEAMIAGMTEKNN